MFRNSSRPVWAFLALFLAVCFAWIGTAQAAPRVTPCSATTADNEICIVGTAATTDKNTGTVLTRPPTFRIEQKTGTGAYATVASNLATLPYLVKNLAPNDYIFKVYQGCVSVPNVVNCAESDAATTNAKNIGVPTEQPNAPVIIIAATIRAGQPPIYRIVYTVTPRTGEIVFVAPASMRPVFAAR